MTLNNPNYFWELWETTNVEVTVGTGNPTQHFVSFFTKFQDLTNI